MSHDTVAKFVEEQLAPWRGGIEAYDKQIQTVWRSREATPSIYLFHIRGCNVHIEMKKTHLIEPHTDPFLSRARTYQDLIEASLIGRPLLFPLSILIDTGDEAADWRSFPIFTFQKHIGSCNVLLPDVEIMTSDYFDRISDDEIPFLEKQCKAAFAGSTTGGGIIDADVLATNTMPRLRAARFFRDKPDVDFLLTSIVQCSSASVEIALRSEGFGGDRVGWSEAYRCKFGLSMDGNGAACSRPGVLLRSRCALVKYHSDKVLYYFSGLQPNIHFIPVSHDVDVLTIIEEERQYPGMYRPIADAGREFGLQILHRKAILDYTHGVLGGFLRLAQNNLELSHP